LALLVAVVGFMRANEESATKAMRVRAAYDAKRAQLTAESRPSKPFSRRLPGWLSWDDAQGGFAVIKDRAKVIRRIFAQADAGIGQQTIARELNKAGAVPFLGERWHRSYVAKLLRNPAVIGTFTPHVREHAGGKTLRRPCDPVIGYWPAIVSKEVFERVSNRVSTTAAKGRHSNQPVTSLVAGVVKCSCCGGSMIRLRKRNCDYLVCSKAHARAGCKYLTLWLTSVEGALTANAERIYEEAPRGGQAAVHDEQLASLDALVDELADEARDLTSELVATKSPSIRQRLAAVDAQLQEARDQLREAGELRARAASPFVAKRLEAMRDTLLATPLDVALANRALREAVSKIVVNPEVGELDIHWHHGGQTSGIPVESRHDRPFEPVPSSYVYRRKRQISPNP
jgi:hypothetical protein